MVATPRLEAPLSTRSTRSMIARGECRSPAVSPPVVRVVASSHNPGVWRDRRTLPWLRARFKPLPPDSPPVACNLASRSPESGSGTTVTLDRRKAQRFPTAAKGAVRFPNPEKSACFETNEGNPRWPKREIHEGPRRTLRLSTKCMQHTVFTKLCSWCYACWWSMSRFLINIDAQDNQDYGLMVWSGCFKMRIFTLLSSRVCPTTDPLRKWLLTNSSKGRRVSDEADRFSEDRSFLLCNALENPLFDESLHQGKLPLSVQTVGQVLDAKLISRGGKLQRRPHAGRQPEFPATEP